MKHESIAILFGITLVLTSAPTWADEPSAVPQAKLDEAKMHHRRARELYDENNFRGALVEMQRAHELSKNPRLQYDLGQIHYQLQDYPSALNAFTKYLEANKDLPQARVDDVRKDIDRLRTRIGTIRITSARPGAQVLVDDVSVGVTPLAEPALVGAGRHKIVATSEGQTSLPKLIDIAGGEEADVDLVFAEAFSAHGKPRGGSVIWVPWAITGGLAVATAVAGGVALTKSSSLTTALGTRGITRAEIDSAHSAAKSAALASDVLLGATIAGAVTSLVLTVTQRPSSSAPQTTVTARLGVGGVGLTGTF